MRPIIAALLVCTGPLLNVVPVMAGPVLPQAVTLTQPDGAPIEAMPYGDEGDSGYETLDGYTIVLDSSGWWSYAALSADGVLVPSGLIPGMDTPVGLSRHLRMANVYDPNRFLISPQGQVGRPANIGTQPVLLLLVSFSDRAAVGSTAVHWNAAFFAPTNSVKHYYQQVSYNQLSLAPATESHGTANDGVIGWLDLGYPHPNTGAQTDYRNQFIRAAHSDADTDSDAVTTGASCGAQSRHTPQP